MVWKICKNKCALLPEIVFVLDRDTRTRVHQFKIVVPRVNLEVEKIFFSVRVIAAWNSVTAEAVVSSDSLGIFKRLRQKALNQVLYDYVD